MALADRIDQKLAALVEAANDFMPDGIRLSYAIQPVDKDDGTPEADEVIVARENEMRANYQHELHVLKEEFGKAWADDDLPIVSGVASQVSDARVYFELRHADSETRVYRSYALSTLVNLWRDGTKTNEEKRVIIRNQLQSFYADLQARLP